MSTQKKIFKEDFDYIKDYIGRMDIKGSYEILGKEAEDDLKESLYVGINIIALNGDNSHLAFTYNKKEQRVEDISAKLLGKLVKKRYYLLSELENLSRGLGCTEMRTSSDSVFWNKTDWFKFPDGTYRKCLRPHWN